MNTMEYEEVVKLKSGHPFKHTTIMELESFLRTRNINLYFFDLEDYCIKKCQELIKQEGLTCVLSLIRLREAFLPKVDANDVKKFTLLVDILRNKLTDLAPSHSLILLDNFLFAPNIADRQTYLRMVEDIFAQVINGIKEVRFITSSKHYDKSLYEDIERLFKILNNQVVIECKTTEDFHDRFWIVDEVKGLFIGTSLNGIGKRYALVDNMSDEDTKTIVEELRKLDLL